MNDDMKICDRCDGNGKDIYHFAGQCHPCNGTGKVWETIHERYTRYFSGMGWWFASNTEMDVWAKKQSFLKPITDLVGEIKDNWKYTYVPKDFTIDDLPKIFKYEVLNSWGIYHLNTDFQI